MVLDEEGVLSGLIIDERDGMPSSGYVANSSVSFFLLGRRIWKNQKCSDRFYLSAVSVR